MCSKKSNVLLYILITVIFSAFITIGCQTAPKSKPPEKKTAAKAEMSEETAKPEAKIPLDVKVIFNVLALGLEEVLWNVDETQTARMLDHAIAHEAVVYAAIYSDLDDYSGRIKNSDGIISITAKIDNPPTGIIIIQKKIYKGDNYLGKIELGIKPVHTGTKTSQEYAKLPAFVEVLSHSIEEILWNLDDEGANSLYKSIMGDKPLEGILDENIPAIAVVTEDGVFAGQKRMSDGTIIIAKSVDDLPVDTSMIQRIIKRDGETLGKLMVYFKK